MYVLVLTGGQIDTCLSRVECCFVAMHHLTPSFDVERHALELCVCVRACVCVFKHALVSSSYGCSLDAPHRTHGRLYPLIPCIVRGDLDITVYCFTSLVECVVSPHSWNVWFTLTVPFVLITNHDILVVLLCLGMNVIPFVIGSTSCEGLECVNHCVV